MRTNPRDVVQTTNRNPSIDTMFGDLFTKHSIIPYGFLLVVCTLSPVCTVFEIFDFKKCRDLEIRIIGHSRSSEPTQIDPPPMTSYLTFHSNHGPISYRFRDKRQFQSKVAKLSHPNVLCVPAEGVPLGIGYRR